MLACTEIQTPTILASKPKIIHLQPFNDFSDKDVHYILNELKKIYPSIVLNKKISLPKHSLNLAQTRYRADSLLKYLSQQTQNGHLTIGLTNKDISTTKNGIADWGVMGLGYCPGKSCVASSFRLSKSETLNQLYKVAIHELGHTEGLPHCPIKTCFMRDAEGKNYTNEETGFCQSCKATLVSKGWQLNNH
jgi:archaemetzincin